MAYIVMVSDDIRNGCVVVCIIMSTWLYAANSHQVACTEVAYNL